MNRPGWIGTILACAIALFANGAALSGDQADAAGGLRDAVSHAWLRAPQAAAQDAYRAEAQAAQEVAAGWIPEPARVSLGSLSDQNGRNPGRQEWEIELAAPLWLPGQRAARGAEADGLADEAAAGRAAAMLEIAGAVREAWWSLAAARAARDLTQRRLDTAQALAADVRKRFRVGELSRIDDNLAQGEALAAKAEHVDAEAALLQAEQAFRLLAGYPAPALLAEETLAPDGTLAEKHPLVAAATAAAHASRARARVADTSRRAAPEIALRVVRERNEFSEPYGTNIGVRVTFPLSSDALVRRGHRVAEAGIAKADAEVRRARLQVRLERERAGHELAVAGQQLALAQARLALAEDNLRLSEKAFALGESDLATLLRIRAAARDAANTRDRQHVARSAAISRFNQTMGVLP